jgi:ubiquitin-protein ligase
VTPIREARLRADFRMVSELVSQSGGTIRIEETTGNPPEIYVLGYRCTGIERLNANNPVYRSDHRVRIELPANYPGHKPLVAMLTPIFHPHIWENNIVCIGQWKINEYLDRLVLRIGAIIQYDPQYFDFGSPANHTAASWAQVHKRLFPVGTCNFTKPANGSGEISWTTLK